MWEGGEAQVGDTALLAVSDGDSGGDELLWIGATVPSTTKRKKRSDWEVTYPTAVLVFFRLFD